MKQIVLEVEDIKSRSLFEFHKELLSQIENPKVLVFLWTTKDEEKRGKYKKIIGDYFNDLGAEVIFFHELSDFDRANVIYIPGGDTEILLEKLNRNPEVVKKIKEFNGIIIGNSAGAIALAKEGYGHKNEKLVKYKGLGLVDVMVLVHFRKQDLKELKESVLVLEEGDAVRFVQIL